jgi:hypothetical protein
MAGRVDETPIPRKRGVHEHHEPIDGGSHPTGVLEAW